MKKPPKDMESQMRSIEKREENRLPVTAGKGRRRRWLRRGGCDGRR
jgi:hypothetical protein